MEMTKEEAEDIRRFLGVSAQESMAAEPSWGSACAREHADAWVRCSARAHLSHALAAGLPWRGALAACREEAHLE